MTDTEIMSWASPRRDIRIAIWWLGTGEIQLRETWAWPGAPTPEIFPGTETGYATARAIARLRAELIKSEQEA